jgi:hypothetical protein
VCAAVAVTAHASPPVVPPRLSGSARRTSRPSRASASRRAQLSSNVSAQCDAAPSTHPSERTRAMTRADPIDFCIILWLFRGAYQCTACHTALGRLRSVDSAHKTQQSTWHDTVANFTVNGVTYSRVDCSNTTTRETDRTTRNAKENHAVATHTQQRKQPNGNR